GFIGSQLADRLVSDGEEVLVFDDLSTGNEHNFSNLVEKNSLRLVRGDIRNPRALKDCLSGINTVVHLAGITSVSRSLQNPQECAEINVGGEQTRDFIHVRDVIDALTSVIQGHEARVTFNVGTGRRVTINYLAETILKLSHKPHQRLSHGPPRPGEVRHSQANIGRLK